MNPVMPIELRVRTLPQMFDAFDPSPFGEQDLAPHAESYIIESAKEMPGRSPRQLIIHLDERSTGIHESVVADAVRGHFQRRVQRLRLELRELLGRGWTSLAIGLATLVLFFLAGRFVGQQLGQGAWPTLARESLLIGGWVAMWRPLEIFLYDWWPIVGERRLAERLARLEVSLSVAGQR